MIEYAVAYAEAGFPVFPLSGKQPYAKSHGVLEASTDPAIVRAAFEARPRPNIGYRVTPGVVILDIDPRNGGSAYALQRRYGVLPPTPSVLSGRGDGGEHLWFAFDGQVVRSATKSLGIEGIDVLHGYKACYTVLPPSIHPATKRPYRWTADPLGELAPLPDSIIAAIAETDLDLLARLTDDVDGRRHINHRLAIAYDAATTWDELLSEQGWAFIRTRDGVDYWRRPSTKKSSHFSASVGYGGSDLLYVWSESIPELETGRTYTRYEFTLATEFDDDEDKLRAEIAR